MSTVAPTIAMLAAIVLAVFGTRQVWRGTERTKGILMLVMAAVLIANTAIWTM